jgi:cell division protein FtsB
MRTHERNLYRVSIALLTAALLTLACRHYAAVRGLDTLRAQRQLDKAYVRALEEENGEAAAQIADLKTENEGLRAENRDMFEGLEMIRRAGKPMSQAIAEGLIVPKGQYTRRIEKEVRNFETMGPEIRPIEHPIR